MYKNKINRKLVLSKQQKLNTLTSLLLKWLRSVNWFIRSEMVEMSAFLTMSKILDRVSIMKGILRMSSSRPVSKPGHCGTGQLRAGAGQTGRGQDKDGHRGH